MALYIGTLTVPPKTPDNVPVSVSINVGVRRLKRAEILFPNGCLGTVGVRLLEGNRQLAPLPSGWLRDNDRVIAWEENRILEGPPFNVRVEGYSLARDWPHTVVIRLEVTQ
jgi:hypothetical protein